MGEMVFDVISQEGQLFLGSRLKRLSDNLLNDATKIVHHLGYVDLFPSHMAILRVLMVIDEIGITQLAQNLGISQPAITRNVNSLKKLGIIKVKAPIKDSRQKLISLTQYGKKICEELSCKIWNKIALIMAQITNVCEGDFLNQITQIENQLAKKSFYDRFIEDDNYEIIDFEDTYASDFYEINRQWIEDIFNMEELDEEILSNPRQIILNNGGQILLAKHKIHGIIGTCALINMGNGVFELAKMGVLKNTRGLKIGEALLRATIERAKAMKISRLFLLTNKKAEAAIHLYEKLGFVHSQEIMNEFGQEYERANVAMIYIG